MCQGYTRAADRQLSSPTHLNMRRDSPGGFTTAEKMKGYSCILRSHRVGEPRSLRLYVCGTTTAVNIVKLRRRRHFTELHRLSTVVCAARCYLLDSCNNYPLLLMASAT